MSDEFITEVVWRKSDDPDARCKRCGQTRSLLLAENEQYAEGWHGRCYFYDVDANTSRSKTNHKFGKWHHVRLYLIPETPKATVTFRRWNDGRPSSRTEEA